MSAGVLLAVLLGAFLHASWNVLVKAGHDTSVAVAGVYIGAGILSAIALPFLPAPSAASWPYLAASTVVEVLYAVLLAAAYRLGDLSPAYPPMRGPAPLVGAIGSGGLVGDPLSGRPRSCSARRSGRSCCASGSRECVRSPQSPLRSGCGSSVRIEVCGIMIPGAAARCGGRRGG